MLTKAQQRALEIIKKEYGSEPFSKPHDSNKGRDVSSATLRKLYQLGYIEHIRTDVAKYYVRDARSFGSGSYNQKTSYENVWRLKDEHRQS